MILFIIFHLSVYPSECIMMFVEPRTFSCLSKIYSALVETVLHPLNNVVVDTVVMNNHIL